MFWSLLLTLLGFAPTPPTAAPAVLFSPPVVDSVVVRGFMPDRASFEVRFGDAVSPYRVMAMFALPGERVALSAGDTTAAESTTYAVTAAAGSLAPAGAARWTWTAPRQAGVDSIVVRDARTGDAMTLHVFVLVPYAAMKRGAIHGYRIGAYPRPRGGHEAEYQRPRGFVQVTPGLLDVAVSPHFTLGQFVCKEAAGYPRYLVLREPLLVKLEQLLAAVNARGIAAHTFAIMSAYRTPVYNAAIGNVTVWSRHEYGDAADIFVDEDGDGVMDDLNHDGRHTIADAQVLGAIVHELEGQPRLAGLVGGLGTYEATPAHGPFTHVDVRGFDVQWSA